MNLLNLIKKWLTTIMSWLFKMVMLTQQIAEFGLIISTGIYNGFKDLDKIDQVNINKMKELQWKIQ